MSNELGIDRSGNNNNWTVNNITYSDQVVDSPTNNFATLNPLIKNSSITYSEGNLAFVGGDADYRVSTSTMAASSGKWYAEFYAVSGFSAVDKNVGIYRTDNTYVETTGLGNYSSGNTWSYGAHGNIRHTSVNRDTEATFTNGDIIQVAMDLDNNKLYFGKNNTYVNSGDPTSGATGTGSYAIVSGDAYHFAATTINSGGAALWVANFGQDSSFAGNKTAQGNQDSNGIGDFYYTPPTGFLALCTKNLPDVAVVPSEHFNTVLYTGTGSSQSVDIGFQTDFVWNRKRNDATNFYLQDVVRGFGASKSLSSNTTSQEGYDGNPSSQSLSVGSSAITVNGSDLNENNLNFVSWNWKANGSGSSNTNGSITSTVSANVDAGFSIVSYTGNGTAGATIGHSLTSKPDIIIAKDRDDPSTSNAWAVYNSVLGATKVLYLEKTNAEGTSSVIWNDTEPTSSVFSVGSWNGINKSGDNYIAYCFHSVDGYSKVGSYTGNGNDDGTFVYTGFRPAWVMTKKTSSTSNWTIIDSTRSEYNDPDDNLQANTNIAEFENTRYDILSNGFKMRRGASGDTNTSGATYIYIAFAETPFKYSNAR